MGTNEVLMVAVLVFGALALGGAVVVAIKETNLSPNFVKLFGLLFIATLATAIVFIEIDSDTRTGAYTILGTIAGYLAGSRPVPTTEGEEEEDKNNGGSDGPQLYEQSL